VIRPAKYLDLNTSVLRIAAEVLVQLQRTHAIPLAELDESLQSRIGEAVRLNFVPALNLLFLLGALDYDDDADALVRRQTHQARGAT
jgi:hypothetical protein